MQRTFLYKEIADDLRQQIGRGESQSQKLPSERALMLRYGVQRSTVRRALSILVAEGRITSASKRGSFINPLSGSSAPPSEVKAAVGTVLVVTQWNEASTALESLLRGLRDSLAESQLSLLFFDSRPRHGKSRGELPTAEYLRANEARGIVLWPESPADLQALHNLRQLAPLVLVDRQVPGFETHSVVFDDFAGGRAVTEHLIALGHRRIGFLTDEVFAESVQQRWRGYVQALENTGIATDPGCCGLFQGMSNPPYSAQMRLLLEGGGRPLTAVVCSNDTVALDFIHFVRREGYRVPEDIAVTGFGNLLPASMEAMRLTTVLQPFEEAGRAVGRILLSHVVSANPAQNTGEYEHVEVSVQLVVRESREVSGDIFDSNSRPSPASAADRPDNPVRPTSLIPTKTSG